MNFSGRPNTNLIRGNSIEGVRQVAKRYEGWQSDNGDLFDNEHDAHFADLRAMIEASDGTNSAGAFAIAKHFDKSLSSLAKLQEIVEAMIATHPSQPQPSLVEAA